MKHGHAFVSLFLLVSSLAVCAHAQEPVRAGVGAIDGRVLDDCYEPIANAEVVVLKPGATPDEGIPVGVPATTNELGQFRIAGLPPGNYFVRATSLTAPSDDQMRYGTAYYPATTRTLREALPVVVATGETASGITINLWTVPYFDRIENSEFRIQN